MLWRVKENRRAASRHRYDGNNTRIGIEGCLTRQCQVIDLSRTGVRLAVANADSLPNTFILFLSNSRSGRSVRVKWRRGNEIGAEFFSPPSPRLNASAPSATKPRGVEGRKSESRMSTSPLHGQRDDQLKADAGVVSSSGAKVKTGSTSDKGKIGSSRGHKPKIEAQHQITDVKEQRNRPNQETKHTARMDLSRLEKKLGPKHATLIQALKVVEPDSPHGRELASIIESLNKAP